MQQQLTLFEGHILREPPTAQSHAASCTHPATVPAEERTDGSHFGRSCATRCWLDMVQGAVLCLTALFVSSWALLRSYKQRELFHRHLEYPLTITLKSERQFSPFLHSGDMRQKEVRAKACFPCNCSFKCSALLPVKLKGFQAGIRKWRANSN